MSLCKLSLSLLLFEFGHHCFVHVYFPDCIHSHRIIHQQDLCGKVLNMKDVTDVVIKTVNSVHTRGLQMRLYRTQWEDAEAEHTELLLHAHIRWPSRGKLVRLSEDFLRQSKDVMHAQLDDEQWLVDIPHWLDNKKNLGSEWTEFGFVWKKTNKQNNNWHNQLCQDFQVQTSATVYQAAEPGPGLICEYACRTLAAGQSCS